MSVSAYLNKVYDWFEERLVIQAIADDITSKYVPPHVNIFYCLGGIMLTCFLVKVATGFAMNFYYRPTVARLLLLMMVLMMIPHVFCVYLTGGFKKPRELTWVTSVVTAVLHLLVNSVPDAIPVIGSPLVELLHGSASVGQSTLTHFYSLHTFVLPLLTAIFMLMHFLMIRKQGIYGPL
ncbi:unnamed protein product [Withania somnifera]